MKSRVVAGVLIKKGSAYLFGKKKKDIGPFPNTWVMIGGGINLGEESMTEAVRREVREETGLEIKNLKKLQFDEDTEPDKNGDKTHYIFLVFTADYSEGKEKPGDDIVELRWIKKKDFKKHHSFARPTVKLFREIGWL